MAETTKSKSKLKPLRRTRGAEAWDEPVPTAAPARTKIDGAKLVPKDITVISTVEYHYWIGLTADCACSTLNAAGIRFPKMEELLDPAPGGQGKKLRRPVIGKIHRLREAQILAIIEELPRLVIRNLPGQVGEVKGFAVRIPTAEQIKVARKLGRPGVEYVAQKGDVPAAQYMYAVLCPDQDNPTRGLHYPPSLAEIGIEWPDELE